MRGVLYVVPTPIGNLEDITLRALRILKEVDLIAAEDTRRTARLLHRYAISTPTTSYHEHNERQKTPLIVARLESGQRVALVSDAGMPGVSDPGERLVRAARACDIPVEVLPGPSAILTALIASGFPAESFSFLGFPPNRGNARQVWLRALAAEPRTVVFFEAPHRIRETLAEVGVILGDRHIAVARELTKVHEQLVIGPITQVLDEVGTPLGEFTVVVSPKVIDKGQPTAVLSDEQLAIEFGQLTEQQHLHRRQAIAELATRHGRPSRAIYSAVERAKASVKQQNN